MEDKDLLHALNDIDSNYVKDAGEQKPKRARGRMAIVGLAACLVLIAGAVWGWRYGRSKTDPAEPDSKEDARGQDGSRYAKFAVAQAQYPECAVYPNEEDFVYDSQEAAWESYSAMMAKWREERSGRIRASEGYREALYPFYETTMKELLVSEENANRTYSPLNLYMALSMLAELTDGNSRAQVLELLSAPDIAAVRERATALWTANYSDDGKVTSILANSLWLRRGVEFIPETMQTLAQVYHASSFQGEMGSEEFTQAFRAWLNEQTGGLLKEQTEGIEMDCQTVLELASTIYYSAQWTDRFYEGSTKEEIFHKADGDVACDFMHQKKMGICYRGENFSAVCLGLQMSGGMWLFLPDEGASVNDVAGNGQVLRLIREGGGWEDKTYATINFAMPKFDVASEIDLVDGLKAMGITDVFEVETADFSPMKENAGDIALSEAKHASRVAVDEKGCIAAAYTIMATNDSAALAPPQEIDFVLDRPFLFAITGADDTILFIGVVEEP